MAANILEITKNGVTTEIGADSRNVDYTGNIPNVDNANDALEALHQQITTLSESIADLSRVIDVQGKWLSLGTSITYQDHDTNAGYQSKVAEFIHFTSRVNGGQNGGTLLSALNHIESAEYVTIEHGVNDWYHGTAIGTIDDFKNATGTSTFYGIYRAVIDAIYTANANAQIIICTPRKADKYGDLPDHWYEALNGKYLHEYADAAIEVAKFCSFPVCDWFNECNTNDWNLDVNSLSTNGDPALHPNGIGHQKMANLLVQTFKKVLACG